jgi:hypothetical protein
MGGSVGACRHGGHHHDCGVSRPERRNEVGMARSSRMPDVRHIKPEMIQLGDLITVRFKEDAEGITTARTARVAKREYQGQDRVLLTAQRAEIFRWAPGHAAPTITLIDRPIEAVDRCRANRSDSAQPDFALV